MGAILRFSLIKLPYRAFSSSASSKCFDIVIIGGGIVGVAAAREILIRKPHLKCALVEKEPQLASHQSSHNSGVIHAGVYYAPGSMRAMLCRKGMDMAYKYCNERGLPYKEVGKLIVATDEEELPRLEKLYERGLANEVKGLRFVEAREIADIEPHCVGIRALHSPHTGIVDWELVARNFGSDFQGLGGTVYLNFELKKLLQNQPPQCDPTVSKYSVKLVSGAGEELFASNVLCCAGLHADRVAELSGGKREPAILPVRGEFLELREEKRYLVKGNIYPVPDPTFPFLGVHFTPRMDGRVLIGPNAVLAFKREGYTYADISIADCLDFLMYPGFQRLALNHLSFGLGEFSRSVFMGLQLKKVQKFLPQITSSDIKKGPSGVRAQALSLQGELIEDFIFEWGEGENSKILHCRNAPSPAATSSLAIAEVLADKILESI